ncbi:hypothetical protein DPMN_058449 [Dreissena polymorpha]|uniref:Uncharacterized protein n=1 Tax=Dreissena polymorpha TaxID=45954 RepID=A0A9D4C1S5_DREPO|nr:hypothetical protein DPMN_058449 [Dreissena polymorpha]
MCCLNVKLSFSDLSEETKPEIGKKGPSTKKLSKTESTSELFSGGNIDQEMEDTPSVKRKTRKTKESDKIIDEQSENENEDIVANESKKKPKPNRKLPKEKSVTNDSASMQQFGTENKLKTTPKSDTNNQQTKQPKSSGKKTKIKSEAVIVKEEPEETKPDGPTAQERLQQKLRERQKQARSKKRSK